MADKNIENLNSLITGYLLDIESMGKKIENLEDEKSTLNKNLTAEKSKVKKLGQEKSKLEEEKLNLEGELAGVKEELKKTLAKIKAEKKAKPKT